MKNRLLEEQLGRIKRLIKEDNELSEVVLTEAPIVPTMLRRFLGRGVVSKLETSMGDDVIKNLESLFARGATNFIKDATGDVFILSRAGTKIPMKTVSAAFDNVATGKMTVDDLVKFLPSKLKDGTDFKIIIQNELKNAKPKPTSTTGGGPKPSGGGSKPSGGGPNSFKTFAKQHPKEYAEFQKRLDMIGLKRGNTREAMENDAAKYWDWEIPQLQAKAKEIEYSLSGIKLKFFQNVLRMLGLNTASGVLNKSLWITAIVIGTAIVGLAIGFYKWVNKFFESDSPVNKNNNDNDPLGLFKN
jgi:multisubunit Na+/H+ antiporter MnhC subunit